QRLCRCTIWSLGSSSIAMNLECQSDMQSTDLKHLPKAIYRLRGQTIELVFADFKEHRGLRRFSGHGLARVRTEVALEVLVHNLLVLHRFSSQKQHGKATKSTTEKIAA